MSLDEAMLRFAARRREFLSRQEWAQDTVRALRKLPREQAEEWLALVFQGFVGLPPSRWLQTIVPEEEGGSGESWWEDGYDEDDYRWDEEDK